MPTLKDYLHALGNVENPVYIAIFLIVVLIVLIYFIFRYVIQPLRVSHYYEKKELELKNARLMALFTELDPDPVLRINEKGVIIYSNNSSKKISPNINLVDRSIKEILPDLKLDIDSFIKKDGTMNFSMSINDKHYAILIRGTSYLNIAQIYFRDISERVNFEIRLRDSEKKYKELSGHLQDKLEEERIRIARELHDSIGQNLLLLKLHMQGMFEENHKEMNSILTTIESTLVELRSIIQDLKPQVLDELGLNAALNLLCEKVSKDSDISGSIDIIGLNERLDQKIEITIFRTVQEILNNIVKHSRAKEFNIQLIDNPKYLRLLVSDDGIGMDYPEIMHGSNSKGFGLLNIKERVENINGKLKIDSSSNNGTLVVVEIPKNGQINE